MTLPYRHPRSLADDTGDYAAIGLSHAPEAPRRSLTDWLAGDGLLDAFRRLDDWLFGTSWGATGAWLAMFAASGVFLAWCGGF